MSRNICLSLAVVALGAGCDLSRTRVGDPNAHVLSTGVVTGVVYLPSGMSESEWCSRVSIEPEAEGVSVGHVSIRESRGRCSFQINNLPAERQISIRLKLPACPSGADASLAQAPRPLVLKDHETRTQDYRATCAS